MSFDGSGVMERIAALAMHFAGSTVPPAADGQPGTHFFQFDEVIHYIHTQLVKSPRVLIEHPVYWRELKDLVGQLEKIRELQNQASCDSWIDYLPTLGEHAHQLCWYQYGIRYTEFLHAIRHVILENILADKECTESHRKKIITLRSQLVAIGKKLETERISPDASSGIEHTYQKNRYAKIREICWLGDTDILVDEKCDSGPRHKIFPRAVFLCGQHIQGRYRYLNTRKTKKNMLSNPLLPIVLSTGEKGFYCYYAKVHKIHPSQNHRNVFHNAHALPCEEDDLSSQSEMSLPPLQQHGLFPGADRKSPVFSSVPPAFEEESKCPALEQ